MSGHVRNRWVDGASEGPELASGLRPRKGLTCRHAVAVPVNGPSMRFDTPGEGISRGRWSRPNRHPQGCVQTVHC